MIKSELISTLTEKQGHLSYKDIEKAVKETFDLMGKALAQGERIEIRGFGSFSLRYRASRDARNPRTGELIITKEKYAIHFKPGRQLKERVNNL
jgi:integration host factor subunit beta